MFKEELLSLLLKLKRNKRKPYYTLNEILRYIMYHDSSTSAITILAKLRKLEKQHFIRRIRKIKYSKDVWGFTIYESVYVIYDKIIERYLKYKDKVITL